MEPQDDRPRERRPVIAPIRIPVRIADVFEELRRAGRRYVVWGTRGGESSGDPPGGGGDVGVRGGAVGFGFSGFGGAGSPSSKASTLSSCQMARSRSSAVAMS
jgi:hypothetical protein